MSQQHPGHRHACGRGAPSPGGHGWNTKVGTGQVTWPRPTGPRATECASLSDTSRTKLSHFFARMSVTVQASLDCHRVAGGPPGKYPLRRSLALSALIRTQKRAEEIKTHRTQWSWELSVGKHPWIPAGSSWGNFPWESPRSPLNPDRGEDRARKSCAMCDLLLESIRHSVGQRPFRLAWAGPSQIFPVAAGILFAEAAGVTGVDLHLAQGGRRRPEESGCDGIALPGCAGRARG